jgi:hypothetical protein
MSREQRSAESDVKPAEVERLLGKYAGRSGRVGFEQARREAWAEIESDLRWLLRRPPVANGAGGPLATVAMLADEWAKQADIEDSAEMWDAAEVHRRVAYCLREALSTPPASGAGQ